MVTPGRGRGTGEVEGEVVINGISQVSSESNDEVNSTNVLWAVNTATAAYTEKLERQ